jgi:hypothetical protein
MRSGVNTPGRSPNDVPFGDDAKIDQAEGNVFYTVPRCDVKQSEGCPEKPKLAFIVDDRPKETINPHQNHNVIALFSECPAHRTLHFLHRLQSEFFNGLLNP